MPADADGPAKNEPDRDDFSRRADEAPPGLIAEFVDFLVHNRKWWLIPIIGALLVVGLIVVLSSSVAAPFIYPLF